MEQTLCAVTARAGRSPVFMDKTLRPTFVFYLKKKERKKIEVSKSKVLPNYRGGVSEVSRGERARGSTADGRV